VRQEFDQAGDPYVAEKIRAALEAAEAPSRRVQLPKVFNEATHPWSIKPVPRRSQASIEHKRLAREGDREAN
jgi:hypothetical protein